MNDKKFRELQMVQVEILDNIHEVCIKNNLKYYLWGGTALGAIRHKGFIPWDVDIDITMPRDDYEKFIQIANIELKSKYKCCTYKEDKNFSSPHILVYLKNSSITLTYDLKNKTKIRKGIYIDIFPLDQVPSDIDERNKHKRDLSIIRKLLYYKSAVVYEKNSNIVIFLKWILRSLFKPISRYELNKLQEKIARRYNNLPNTGYFCSTSSHYKYDKVCMLKKIFGTPKLYEFEGRMYYGPEDIHSCLSQIYGDYMKLPPLNIQEELRNSVVDATWE